jgi:hypothetical protein
MNWTVAKTFLPLALSPRTRRRRESGYAAEALFAHRGEVG